jgi:3-hydroxybutyryl-CoA dehydrogenase
VNGPATAGVCVIGAGVMGAGIAARYAAAGATVELVERDDGLRDSAPFRVRCARHGLAHAASLGYVSVAAARAAADRITVVAAPGESLGEADLVLEAIHDDVAAKHAVYRSIEPVLRDDTVVASTTAALSVRELSRGAPDPSRFLGWHWAFPSLAVTFCEIIPAPGTATEVVEWTVRLARRMGLAATVVEEGTRPGFVLNRIWYAMMDEARAILAEGSVTEDVVDRLYETSQRWPKGPCRVDREDADVVGDDAWPALTVAALGAPLDASEFRPPEVARG